LTVRQRLALYGERIVGRIVKWLIWLLGRTNPDRASDLSGAIARRLGPLAPSHRIGQANLRAAFPDKDAAWIEQTLREAWDNLGRVAGEYVHMGRIWDFDPEHSIGGRILTDKVPLFEMIRDDGKPALCFAAHLGNWELPAIAMDCPPPWFTGCQTTRRWRRRSSASARRSWAG